MKVEYDKEMDERARLRKGLKKAGIGMLGGDVRMGRIKKRKRKRLIQSSKYFRGIRSVGCCVV